MRSIARTYAVPTRQPGTALNMTRRHLKAKGAYPSGVRVVGTGSNPRSGKPEVLVQVRGHDKEHGSMLSRFEWTGF